MTQTLTLEQLLEKKSELSSLPEVYIEVSQLLDDDNVNSTQIGQVIETDPALTSRILKMVNSAFYGFPREISSIAQAITILGRERLRQILIGTVLSGVFGKIHHTVFAIEDYWYHSVKTALLARHLAIQAGEKEQSEALFTAGLLHQIGCLIQAQYQPDVYREVRQQFEDGIAPLIVLEQKTFGYSHCDVGAAFIDKWGLPELLSEAAHYYPVPANSENYEDLVNLVHIADELVILVAPIQQAEVELVLEDITGWKQSGLSVDDVTLACIYAEEQVRDVMESLGMVQMKIEVD